MSLSLNDFHRINAERARTAFAPEHELMALVACVQEEVGELAAAVLGVTGEKKRKAHMTNADVLDAVADAMTYLSLVASKAGCTDLEHLLADTFNMVSERAGSPLRVSIASTSDQENAPTHYVHRNSAGFVFVKEAKFFADQGGHRDPWGSVWRPVTVSGDPCDVDAIERARAEGERILPAR